MKKKRNSHSKISARKNKIPFTFFCNIDVHKIWMAYVKIYGSQRRVSFGTIINRALIKEIKSHPNIQLDKNEDGSFIRCSIEDSEGNRITINLEHNIE